MAEAKREQTRILETEAFGFRFLTASSQQRVCVFFLILLAVSFHVFTFKVPLIKPYEGP